MIAFNRMHTDRVCADAGEAQAFMLDQVRSFPPHEFDTIVRALPRPDGTYYVHSSRRLTADERCAARPAGAST